MSSSNHQSIQQVVDELLLTGTLHDDLIRMLGMPCKHQHQGWWTSSELLLQLPELRLFFQSNRTFPPCSVLAACPKVQCVTNTKGITQYFVRQDTMLMDHKPAAADDESENDDESTQEDAPLLPNEISLTDSKEEPAKTTDRILKALLKLEDQLVKMIEAAPGQRILKSRLQVEYERIHGRQWKNVDDGTTFSKLIRGLSGTTRLPNNVRIVRRLKAKTFNGGRFIVLQSFDPKVDAPAFNRKELRRLEDEIVDLLRTAPLQRLKVSKGSLMDAYRKKYNKPLQCELTGLFTLKTAIQAMNRVHYRQKCAVLAPRQRSQVVLPRSKTGLPPFAAAAAKSRLPPPAAAKSGLPHGLPPTHFYCPPSTQLGIPPGLPPDLPPGLPPGLLFRAN